MSVGRRRTARPGTLYCVILVKYDLELFEGRGYRGVIICRARLYDSATAICAENCNTYNIIVRASQVYEY